MNPEYKVRAEQRINALENAFHESAKIQEATHGVITVMLKEQRAFEEKVDRRFKAVDEQFETVDSQIMRLAQATEEGFRKAEVRFDKIEETLIQIINRLPD